MADAPVDDPGGRFLRVLGDGAGTALDQGTRYVAALVSPRPGTDDAVTRYWWGVAAATTAYYREWARAASTWRATGGAGPVEQSAGPRARMELGGAVGTTIAATFSVTNSDPEPAAVSIVPGPCRSSGGRPFAAPASIDPATATLPPGEGVDVTVRVTLDHRLFEAGREYVLPVRVDGPRPAAVDLVLAVTDLQEDAVEGPPFRLACPDCARTFERSTRDRRLRRHRDEDGRDCSGRGDGVRLP